MDGGLGAESTLRQSSPAEGWGSGRMAHRIRSQFWRQGITAHGRANQRRAKQIRRSVPPASSQRKEPMWVRGRPAGGRNRGRKVHRFGRETSVVYSPRCFGTGARAPLRRCCCCRAGSAYLRTEEMRLTFQGRFTLTASLMHAELMSLGGQCVAAARTVAFSKQAGPGRLVMQSHPMV